MRFKISMVLYRSEMFKLMTVENDIAFAPSSSSFSERELRAFWDQQKLHFIKERLLFQGFNADIEISQLNQETIVEAVKNHGHSGRNSNIETYIRQLMQALPSITATCINAMFPPIVGHCEYLEGYRCFAERF